MALEQKTTESEEVKPDEIIENIGGCGRYQVRLAIVVHLMKTVFCFNFSNLIIASASPTWWCMSDATQTNLTSCKHAENSSEPYCSEQSCNSINNTKCTAFQFDDRLTTIVSEVSHLFILPNISFLSCIRDSYD